MNRNRRLDTSSQYAGNRGFSSGLLTVLMLTLVTGAATAWVGMGIVAKERWPIRWLELKGSFQRVSAEQLRVSLAPLANSSFFTVDMQGLRDATAKNAWVAEVNVQKLWPDNVTVTVTEYVPVAHWNNGFLISTTGQTFAAPEADEIQGLPWLRGPEGRLQQVLDNWTQFNHRLDLVGLEIAYLTLDERGAWSMQLNTGARLQLGRDAAGERLERLTHSWPTLLQQHDQPPMSVDLRYTNGFAVRWADENAEFAGVNP